MQLAGNATTTA